MSICARIGYGKYGKYYGYGKHYGYGEYKIKDKAN